MLIFKKNTFRDFYVTGKPNQLFFRICNNIATPPSMPRIFFVQSRLVELVNEFPVPEFQARSLITC